MTRQTDSSQSSTQPRSHVLAVLGIALVTRLGVVWLVLTRFPGGWLFTRGVEMGLIARSLLAGHGFSSPFGGETGPTAFVAPVYPILVALVFRIFGTFTAASEIVILLAQVLVNLLTIWLVMRIARRLFNQATATAAGLIWACSPPLLWLPTIFWETSLSCCLLTGLIALVLHYRDQPHSGNQPNPNQWLALGAYCGAAALVNPALLPSLVAIVLWLTVQHRARAAAWPLLSVLTFVLVFSPWPIRNARTFHAFIPLRTTVGFELWMGNRPGATGFLDESVFPMYNREELTGYNAAGEVAYTRHKSGLAMDYIASHPREFLRLTLTRAVRFWTGTGTQHGSALFAIHATATSVLALAGLGLLARSRRRDLLALFAIPFALFPLPYFITHAEFRYRLVLDPLLTIVAASAVVGLYRLLVQAGGPAGQSTAASAKDEDRSGRPALAPARQAV